MRWQCLVGYAAAAMPCATPDGEASRVNGDRSGDDKWFICKFQPGRRMLETVRLLVGEDIVDI